MRAALVLILLGACGGSARERQEDLMDAAREFQNGLRWRNYDQAAAHVPSEIRERFLDAHEELDDNLRVDDYEIERITVEKDARHAMIRVRLTWHLEHVGTVHETVVDESWERQGKVWRILGSAHRRGEEMPPEAVSSQTIAAERPTAP